MTFAFLHPQETRDANDRRGFGRSE